MGQWDSANPNPGQRLRPGGVGPAKGVCRYCGDAANTRDHILPRGWGQWNPGLPSNAPDRIRATWRSCEECNALRSAAGHCPTAMLLLRDVADHMRLPPRTLLALWGWLGPWPQERMIYALGGDAIAHEALRALHPPMLQAAMHIKPGGFAGQTEGDA